MLTEEAILVSRSRENTFLRVTICSVSGWIGMIEEKFNAECCLGIHVFSTDGICILVRPHALPGDCYSTSYLLSIIYR